jgi:hypothetical protein
MTVYLTEELAQAWHSYKAAHPEQSFNGLILQLLKEQLCVIDAPTSTTR